MNFKKSIPNSVLTKILMCLRMPKKPVVLACQS